MADEYVFDTMNQEEEEEIFDTYMEGGNKTVFDTNNTVEDKETPYFDSNEEPIIQSSSRDSSIETETFDTNSEEDTASLSLVEPNAIQETEDMLTPAVIKYNPDEVTKDFFMSANAQTSIGMFMKGRYGKSGIKKDDETKDEYAERFFEKMRWMQNNIASTGSGIAWLHDANETEKKNFGILYSQFNDMPSFYEDGGGDAINGVLDTVLSVVLDPTNVATLGIATGFKIMGGRLAANTLLKSAINSNKGRIAGAASVEGILGAMQAGNIQSLEKKANLRTDKDWDTILAMGVLSAGTAGAINIAMFKKGLSNDTYKEQLAVKMDDARKKLKINPEDVNSGKATDKVFDAENGTLGEQIKDIATIFDNALDINRTNAASPVTRITVDMLEDAKQVAAEVFFAIPELRPRDNEKISLAFTRAFYTIDVAPEAVKRNIDDALVDAGVQDGLRGANFTEAMARLKNELDDVGIDAKEFAFIANVDVSTAGKILKQFQTLQGIADKLDGGVAQRNRTAIGIAKRKDIVNASWALRALNATGRGVMKIDRVRRAIMTSQPATTARNVVSGTAAVSMHVASRMLRNTYAGIGSVFDVATGKTQASFRGTVDGLSHIVTDSFSMVADIFNHGANRELVDVVLDGNAILHHQLLRTTQEAGTNALPSSVMLLNSLNIAQDQFLRTGVFMNSVNRQMKELMEVDDVTTFLARGKKIPTQVAQTAVDEALAITFANVPKNGVAAGLIKVVESLPFVPVIGTGAFPFARFMANAISFQFRYLPTNSIGAIFTKMASKKLIQEGKPGGQRLAKEASRQFSDGIVGGAGIMAAIYYRSDKQDTTTYDEIMKEDGSTIGIGAVFPLPFYLMLGDMYVKAANGNFNVLKSGDIITAMTGFQASAGGVNYFLDNFLEVMADNGIGEADVASEKFLDAFGKYTGELAGQYFTPLKLVRDVVAAFDEEQNLRRDPNVVTSKGGDRFVDSFLNKAAANLPYQLQEMYNDKPLPAQQDAVRGPDQYNVAPMLTQITGMKIMPARRKVENELLKMGLKPYLMLTPTGDKQADALIRKHMPEFLDAIMLPIIETDYYKNKTLAGKKNTLAEAKALVIKYAKERAQGDFAEARNAQGYSPAIRAKWGRLPKNKRKEANEMWVSMYGESIETSNSYEAGIQLVKSLPGL